jgi:uncharacterized tellurite resistance protein B-like protein
MHFNVYESLTVGWGMIVVDRIRSWLDQDKSVRRVADDLQLTSELILLVRMMFADGKLLPEELENFKRICKIAFGIPEEDVPQVIEYLREFGYETTVDDAAVMFEQLDDDRKRSLLLHMMSIAKSDKEVHAEEVDLIRRTASILGLEAADLQRLRN